MTEQDVKRKLVIAFSAYATHKKDEVSLDEWLEVQNLKRGNAAFKKRYDQLAARK